MAENNKIAIEVTISNDGQKQIDNYIHAFDSLRKSINSLSQPLNSISSNLNTVDKNLSKYTDTLEKLNSKNQEFVDNSDKMYDKVTNASSAFVLWNDVIKVFTIELKSWGIALSGVFGIVTAFLPEIIKAVSAFLQGKDAINAMTEKLKNMNAVMKSANKDAADQSTRLQILYKSATDLNNAYSDRVKSAQELKREYPSYFKNLSDEDILTKKAKANYDELSKSIIENAKAKAALNKITEQAAKILDADFQIEKIKNANFNEVERKKRELAKRPKTGRFTGPSNELELFKSESDERAQVAIEEQEQIKKTTKQTIDFLEKYAGGTNAIAKAISGDNEGLIVKSTKHNKAFYEAALAEQQALLDNMDAAAKGFEKRAASIRNKIASISKIVNAYSQPTPKVTISTNKSRPETEALEAHSINFSQQIELDKQYYDTEQALLQNQLDKKLISQEEFNKQSEALQEQYHLAIGDKIKTFNKTDLDTVKQHMQDMVDAHKLKGDIEKDEHDVKKAILPGDKLKAEQQLITDKYNYEIMLAAGNAEKIKQLEEQKQQDLTTLNKQYEQERKEFALQTAQKVSDAAFGILKGSIQSQADAKIKGLETQKQAELANTNLTAGQRKAIEDKYKKKEAEEKVKAFKAEQRASILQAVINGALAITKVTSQTGIISPFVIPGIIAETAIQVATIAKQKAPQYAKGGIHYQSDGRGALLSGYSRMDDTNAYLRSGEAVVVSEAMRNPWARNLVSAINVAYGGRDFSVTNPGRGYAIGGIYTDGGNANRYYNQPVNDVKDLANTVAYQMINNFPPIYVDVKDVNSQQSILAQTINRVNF